MEKDRDKPDSSKGAGDSQTRRGEDVSGQKKEVGRQDTGKHGQTDRPKGESDMRDKTGVDPQDPIDPDSPNLIGP
ncbi:MAG: hypothetical protein M3T49_06310 [Candidatus Eremiobacteraeota bacterium]|nr:hypothetical protein [Candidatus Eremiobacteraeota bacterium]